MSRLFKVLIVLVALWSIGVGRVEAGEKIWLFIPLNSEGHIKLDGLAKVMNKYLGAFYHVKKYEGKLYRLNPVKVFALKLLSKAPALKGKVKIYWEKDRIVIETTKSFFIKQRDQLSKTLLKVFRVFLKGKESKYAYGLISEPDQFNDSKVVVLVHGIESDNKTWDSFTPFLDANKISYLFFQYPNDQEISMSADLLSRELKRFRVRNPLVKVFAITHSMGALVVRKAIEDKALDPGNIRSLLMFAPPNQGSYISILHPLLELGKSAFVKEVTWVDCVFDGMSEAAIDLWPGSSFLKELNQGERCQQCRYSMIIGDKALIPRGLHDKLVGKLKKSFKGSSVNRKVKKWSIEYIKKLTEVISGEGDGAVSVERTKLKGVDDILKVSKNHIRIHHLSDKTSGATQKKILNMYQLTD